MLTFRVAAAILFGAFAVWSQMPEADRNKESIETAAAFSVEPSFSKTLAFKLSASPQTSQFAMNLGQMRFTPEAKEFELAALSNPLSAADPAQTASSSKAGSLSKGYFTRRKIHKYMSFATLPLLAAEYIVGQKLLNGSNPEGSSLRSAHSGLAAGMGVLFGVETVTGVWNMLESRKFSPAHKKQMFHGMLMLAADAGFVATMATAPHRDDEGGLRTNSDASTHKAIAYASIGTAAFSYIYMLFAK
jgi:hypothetical protein